MKPKILHIGGSHSVHVADLVKELDSLGYPQCVLSYNLKNILPKHIPVYFFPYNKFYPNRNLPKDEQQLKNYLAKILIRQKPNIIHGHFLAFSCVAILLAQKLSGLTTYLTPWSAKAWTRDKILNRRINECITRSKYFLLDETWVFNIFKKYYANLKDSMHIKWRMPLYLSTYHDLVQNSKDTSVPLLLSARVMQATNHQELFVQALPAVLSKHPTSKATLIVGQHASQGKTYFEKMRLLAKQLGVLSRCTFIDRALTQPEFTECIKKHNIIYSVADSDMGGSQTTYQSMYSGAITIVKASPYGYAPLIPGRNCLVTELNAASVSHNILYAADNVKSLSNLFFDNSRFLRSLSSEYTIPILTKLYDTEG